MSNKAVSVYADALKRQKEEQEAIPTPITVIQPNASELKQTAQEPQATPDNETTQKTTQPFTQKDTQISNLPNGIPSSRLSNLPPAQIIEELSFRLRKVPKTRVNADVPFQWKERLNETAHQLKVGKYELLVYIIGEFLGEPQVE